MKGKRKEKRQIQKKEGRGFFYYNLLRAFASSETPSPHLFGETIIFPTVGAGLHVFNMLVLALVRSLSPRPYSRQVEV